MTIYRVDLPLILFLIILAILASLCGCSVSRDSQTGGDTLVEEDWYRLTLPGAWTSADSQDESVFVFDSDTEHEQLMVSLFFSEKPMDRSQQKDTCQSLVDIQRQAESDISGASLQLSDVGYGDQGQVVAARFTGSGSPKRQSATLVLCSPDTAAIFHYDTFDLTQAEFETRAASIMNSIELSMRQ